MQVPPGARYARLVRAVLVAVLHPGDGFPPDRIEAHGPTGLELLRTAGGDAEPLGDDGVAAVFDDPAAGLAAASRLHRQAAEGSQAAAWRAGLHVCDVVMSAELAAGLGAVGRAEALAGPPHPGPPAVVGRHPPPPRPPPGVGGRPPHLPTPPPPDRAPPPRFPGSRGPGSCSSRRGCRRTLHSIDGGSCCWGGPPHSAALVRWPGSSPAVAVSHRLVQLAVRSPASISRSASALSGPRGSSRDANGSPLRCATA